MHTHFQAVSLSLNQRVFTCKSTSTSVSPSQSNSFRSTPFLQWDPVSMKEAVKAVELGTSIRKSSLMYNVPRSTLHDRVSGRVAMESRPGRKPHLTIEEEEELVSFLIKCAKMGYAHTRKEVLSLVHRILESKGVAEVITDSWWRRFHERHPNITLRTAMPLSRARAMASDEHVINNYFDLLENTLVNNGILNDPHCIYNCDETGLPLNPKPLKVVDAVGARNPSYITGETKQQITVLACTSAAGTVIPPFVIFNRKTLPPELVRGEVPGSIYGLSSKGWINQDLFNSWFTEHFLSYVPSTRPLLLLLDGHSSHYCPEVIKMASKHKIVVFTLPPHTTHITQPLDRSVFAVLKVYWKQVCHGFQLKHPGRVITQYDFCSLFSEAWSQSMTLRNVTSGFKVTGVYPFNRNVVLEKLPGEKFTSFKPECLPQTSGLAYIPLYSPAPCRDRAQKSVKLDMTLPPLEYSSSEDRCSNYRASTSISSVEGDDDLDKCFMPAPRVRSLSKFLRTPVPPSKLPTKHGKSSGKVLTSFENIQIMEAKEEAKRKNARAKEERKVAREERRRAKAEQKRAAEEQRRLREEKKRKSADHSQLEKGLCSQLKKHTSRG